MRQKTRAGAWELGRILLLAALWMPALRSLAAETGPSAPKSGDTLTVETRHPNGQIKERYRRTLDAEGHEVRHGAAEEFYADGRLKGVVHWQNGREEGDAVFYHPDGRKAYATHYRQGKKLGFATVWYASGQKQWQAMYQDGLTHGVWREWYADGKRKFEAMYSMGRLDGHATWWYPNGRMQQERDYNKGQSVAGSVRAYDSTGTLIFPARDAKAAPSAADTPDIMAETLAH